MQRFDARPGAEALTKPGLLTSPQPRICIARRCELCSSLTGVYWLRSPQSNTEGRAFPAALRVAVVDGGDTTVRAVLQSVFLRSAEFRSCGFFTAGHEALRVLPNSAVSIAMIELELPDQCGIRCAQEMRATASSVRIILTTTCLDSRLLADAVASGIEGYLIKPLREEQCLATLRFLSCHILQSRICSPESARVPAVAPVASLNTLEQRVLSELAQGCLYKEAESHLHVTHGLLKKQVQRIYRKLRAHNRTEAINAWRKAAH